MSFRVNLSFMWFWVVGVGWEESWHFWQRRDRWEGQLWQMRRAGWVEQVLHLVKLSSGG